MLDINLRVYFKDDILEIDMNQCGQWGHGPVWNKCCLKKTWGQTVASQIM